MLILAVLAAAAAAIALTIRGGEADLPARIVVFSANRLPGNRRTWGEAMVAELVAVRGTGQRWRFAAGALRTALFPPAPRPEHARTTTIVGVLTTITATAAAARLVPTLLVFVAAFGVLVTGSTRVLAGRLARPRPTRGQLACGALVVVTVMTVAGTVVDVAITHPVATRDPTYAFSFVLAATLSVYLIAGLGITLTGRTAPATRWGGVAGAGVAVVASLLFPHNSALISPISPSVAAATLATALVVGLVARERGAAARAGLLATVLSAPANFAVAILALQSAHPTALTDPYDISAYSRSASPDVTSYLLGEALGGNIVSLAVAAPAMYVLATLGGRAAAGRAASTDPSPRVGR